MLLTKKRHEHRLAGIDEKEDIDLASDVSACLRTFQKKASMKSEINDDFDRKDSCLSLTFVGPQVRVKMEDHIPYHVKYLEVINQSTDC